MKFWPLSIRGFRPILVFIHPRRASRRRAGHPVRATRRAERCGHALDVEGNRNAIMTSAAGAAREREKLRQAELETERLREAVATLEVQLRHASSTHAKDLAAARAQLGAANERASHAQTRAVALEVSGALGYGGSG